MFSYVYIVGMSHSGSTLLAFLLNSHPDIITVGETSRIGELLPDRWLKKGDRCSCGKPFYYCDFWNRVLAGLSARGYGIGNPDFFKFSETEKDLANNKLSALVESILDVSGKKVLLDASKDPSCIESLYHNPYLDLQILDLYRDGRGIILSWKNRLPQVPLRKLIREWLRREKNRQIALEVISDDKVHRIKYEDLCANSQETLQHIYRFLNVDLDVNFFKEFKSQIEHHIIGNQMRLNANEKIVLDERWRHEMTDGMFHEFEEFGGGSLNREYGYYD